MSTLIKYDGFLPKNDGDEISSSLFQVHLSEEKTVAVAQPVIILLVDVSGSMWGEIEHLKQAVISTVDLVLKRKIATLDNIVLIPFEKLTTVYSHFKNYDELVDKVSKFTAGGGTNYNSAILKVVGLLKERKRIITVMFSDGAPSSPYENAVNELKIAASKELLLFHAIGLNVHGKTEKILRNLTTIGSSEGFYQSIDSEEIEESMNVLVNHFNCRSEVYIDGKYRTRLGFFVSAAEAEYFDVEYNEVKIRLDVSSRESFETMSIATILDALNFLMEYYIKDESFSFKQVISIVEHVQFLTRETENKLKLNRKNYMEKIASERKAKLASICDATGASILKKRSELIAASTKEIHNTLQEYSEYLRRIHEIKELSAQIAENLLKNQNIITSVSGEIMSTVSKFRDNSIALKRKNIARLSSKLREGNKGFEDIDQLLQNEIDQLVKRDNIPVPTYFENYTDPLTLNNFEEIMLHKFGVFMLLITVERHVYGITAPHKTKIEEVGGYSASVLDVMTNNGSSSLIFDFRGMGSGNAAIPLWINDLHWNKAKHVFGPFVGHAVTGNELEYTKMQGSTLLALVSLHLRKQKPTEYNQQLIRMVDETLKVQLDKKKWIKVLNDVTNSFETLNENRIPSIGIFAFFVEFIGVKLQEEKALLLVAEEYRRKNKKRIEHDFEDLKGSSLRRAKKCALLIRMFPKIFQQYLDISPEKIIVSTNKSSIENYFVNLYDGKESDLLEMFDKFSQKIVKVLRDQCSKLDIKQKIAIVLSVHKCICFNWNAIDDGAIPAGFSYNSNYPDLLLEWCRKVIKQKHEKELKDSEQILLLKLLHTNDENEAETIIKNIKRNSHVWGALLCILFRTCKIDSSTGLKRDQWRELRVKKYKDLIESMSIPFHYKLIMYLVYNSFKPEDWISSKMIWRPNLARRRRLKAMFPEAPEIE